MDDIVFLAFVVEFDILLVEGERGLGVVAHVEVHLLAYFALDARLDLLVEIEDVIVPRTLCQGRVLDVLVLESEEQLRRTLHLQLHTAGTEELICRTDIELHVRDIEFLLVVMLHFAHFLLPVLVHDLPLGVFVVLVLCEHVRCRDVRVADTGMDDVRAGLRLVLHGRRDVIRVLQVHRTVRLRQLAVVLRAQLLHVSRCPDSAVRLRHIIRRIFRSLVIGCWLLAFSSYLFPFSSFRFPFRLLLLFRRLLFCYQLFQRLRPIGRRHLSNRHPR